MYCNPTFFEGGILGNLLTKQVLVWYYIKSVRTADSFHDGEMSERFKEPVLKTGDVQASVGSNPTLSATFLNSYVICRSTQEAEGAPLLRE